MRDEIRVQFIPPSLCPSLVGSETVANIQLSNVCDSGTNYFSYIFLHHFLDIDNHATKSSKIGIGKHCVPPFRKKKKKREILPGSIAFPYRS